MKTTLKATAVLALTLLIANTALAERKNPLEGQPAVRHRHELRDSRFEIGPSFGFSVNRSLRQSITFGLKMAYHISDWFSLGADFGYGIGLDTGLTTELERQYSDGSTANRPSCPPPDAAGISSRSASPTYSSRVMFASPSPRCRASWPSSPSSSSPTTSTPSPASGWPS